MFGNKTAWFSSSVPRECCNFWMVEGGRHACWRKADYLFSDDASCPDTLRIFESKDYLWNEVTVFHSLFLSACEKRQSVKSVCVGHYVLPPAPVQCEVRKVAGRLIWEREDDQPETQTEDEYSDTEFSRSNSELFNTDTPAIEASVCSDLWDYPACKMLTGYVSMTNLKKFLGELCDFQPRCGQCFKCEGHCCLARKIDIRLKKKV